MVNQLKLTAPLAAYTGVRDENIRRMYRLLEIAPIVFFVYTSLPLYRSLSISNGCHHF